MPKIYVRKAFVLQHEGEKHEFAVGNHTVSPAVAEHWFVKAHIGEEPAAGGEAGDLAEQRAALDSAGQFLEGKAKELKELQGVLELRAGTVADREKAAEQREADLNARAEALDTREVAIAEREKAADAAAKQSSKK